MISHRDDSDDADEPRFNQQHGRAGVYVWLCDKCRCFHIRVGEMLLTFTPEEYTDFAQRIVECYYGGQQIEIMNPAEDEDRHLFFAPSEALN